MYLYVLDYIPEVLVPTHTKYILVCTETKMVLTIQNSSYGDKHGVYWYIPLHIYTVSVYTCIYQYILYQT